MVSGCVVTSPAAGGDRGVTVTARGRTSNAVNFFVQIPTSARVLSQGAFAGSGILPNGCPANQPFGFQVRIRYQVLDQQQSPVAIIAVIPVRENLFNFMTNGQPSAPNLIDVPVVVGDATQSDGTFIDQPVGGCSAAPFTSSTFT